MTTPMFRKYFIPALAVIGLLFGLYMVKRGNAKVPVSPPVAAPPLPPYKDYISGSGLVEASTENIAVGSLVPGVVSDVFVVVGQTVEKGQPLFKIDDREFLAVLKTREALQATAHADLEKLLNQPRPEEIPIAEAKVAEAAAQLDNARVTLARMQRLEDPKSFGPDELRLAKLNVGVMDAKQKQAAADLVLLKAGAWKPDIDVARAKLAAADADVKAAQINIDRLTVRAPVDGQLLQVKVRVGEFAVAGLLQQPLMVIGKTDQLNVRIDIDENEASRFIEGKEATAYVRGNRSLSSKLTFVRSEPYIVPKRSLTGDSTERVDTRVLQVIYSFDPALLPTVRVGQQMDVYIEALPVGSPIPPTTKPTTTRTSTQDAK